MTDSSDSSGESRRPDRGPRKSGRNQGRRNDERGPRGDGRGRPYRDGDDRKPRRDGDWKPRRDGDWKPRRDGDDRKPRRDGEWKPRRDGDDRKPRRDGEWRPRREDGDRKPRRDGDRRPSRDSYGRGGTRGGNRSDRGGRGRQFTEAERLQHELRLVRATHSDPEIPDYITLKDLHPAARNELKTLQAETQEFVARHLAMVAALIDDDPELAHQHALSASRRAGRIPVAHETLAMTAYRTGDFALTLRELRTYRRLTGLDGHVAIMVDAERGMGKPQKALEEGLGVDAAKLDTAQRVHLAIAMSGARLDLGQTQQALFELEIPELDPKRAYSWSPDLFDAYAAVLEDLGRDAEARTWAAHAERAANALDAHNASFDQMDVLEIVEMPDADAEPDDAEDAES